MNLKLILNTQITSDLLKPINTIIPKLSYPTTYDLWLQIQHLDMFFQEGQNGVDASYDKDCKTIDFRNMDGTLVFYVIQN